MVFPAHIATSPHCLYLPLCTPVVVKGTVVPLGVLGNCGDTFTGDTVAFSR